MAKKPTNTSEQMYAYTTDGGDVRVVTRQELERLDPQVALGSMGQPMKQETVVRTDVEQKLYRDRLLWTNPAWVAAHGPAEPLRGNYRPPKRPGS